MCWHRAVTQVVAQAAQNAQEAAVSLQGVVKLLETKRCSVAEADEAALSVVKIHGQEVSKSNWKIETEREREFTFTGGFRRF